MRRSYGCELDLVTWHLGMGQLSLQLYVMMEGNTCKMHAISAVMNVAS